MQDANAHSGLATGHYENKPSSYHHNRGERQGKDRNAQRSRKLQLSDVDWYGRTISQHRETSRA